MEEKEKKKKMTYAINFVIETKEIVKIENDVKRKMKEKVRIY